MIHKILGRLGQHNYKMIFRMNLTSTSDTLYFVKDESYSMREQDFCMVSLNSWDKIRLIGCPELENAVAQTITDNGNIIQEQN